MRLFSGYFFSFFKVVDIIIDRIISDRETYRKIVLIYPKIALNFFQKIRFFIYKHHQHPSYHRVLYFLCGSRRAGKFEFQIQIYFFLFVSYILSSFCFSLSELNWHHQKFALAKKIRLIFCFGSLLDKLLYKNGTKKCSRVVGRKKASTFFQLFFLFHLVTHGHIFSVKSRRPLNFYLFIYKKNILRHMICGIVDFDLAIGRHPKIFLALLKGQLISKAKFSFAPKTEQKYFCISALAL